MLKKQDELPENGENHEEVLKSKRKKKNISLIGAISFVMGNMIGSGIFVNVAGSASGAPNSPGLTMILWLLGGIIAICGALSYGELCLYFHKSGGEYTYLQFMFGKYMAMSYILSYSVLNAAMSITYAALTAAKYIINAIYHEHNVDPVYEKYMAVIIILMLMLVNMISIKIPDRLQIIFTVAKIIGLIIIIVIGIIYLVKGTANFDNSFDMTGFTVTGLTAAVASSFWSYEGWNTLGHVVGEVSNPKRNIPIAFITGLFSVTGLYLLTIVSYITVLGHDNMVNQKTVALGVGYAVFNNYGWIMSIFIVLSTIGFANGFFYSTARIGMVASYERTLPEFVGLVEKKTRSPSVCVFIIGINSLIYVFVNFDKLIEYSSFVSWTFYVLSGLGLCIFRIRGKFEIAPEFKVPLIFPIVLQLSGIYIFVMTFYSNPLNCFIIFLYMIVSGGVYALPVKYIQWKPLRKMLGTFSYGLKIVFNSELVKESDLYSH